MPTTCQSPLGSVGAHTPATHKPPAPHPRTRLCRPPCSFKGKKTDNAFEAALQAAQVAAGGTTNCLSLTAADEGWWVVKQSGGSWRKTDCVEGGGCDCIRFKRKVRSLSPNTSALLAMSCCSHSRLVVAVIGYTLAGAAASVVHSRRSCTLLHSCYLRCSPPGVTGGRLLTSARCRPVQCKAGQDCLRALTCRDDLKQGRCMAITPCDSEALLVCPSVTTAVPYRLPVRSALRAAVAFRYKALVLLNICNSPPAFSRRTIAANGHTRVEWLQHWWPDNEGEK